MLKDPTALGSTPFTDLCKDKQNIVDFNLKYASVYYIILQKIKNTQTDIIFFQLSLPIGVWDLTVEIMDHFEQVDLCGQTRNFSNLICKPEFRQNYLTPIRTLAIEDQCFLLQKVINHAILLAKMKNEAAEI